MDLHQNAVLTPRRREALAQKVIAEKVTLNAAASRVQRERQNRP